MKKYAVVVVWFVVALHTTVFITGCAVHVQNNWGHHIKISEVRDDTTLEQDYDLKTGSIKRR